MSPSTHELTRILTGAADDIVERGTVRGPDAPMMWRRGRWATWAFTPRAMAKAVRHDAVTEGPYVDSPHVVAGVYILEAPDLDAALATAATNPVVRQGGGLEVRPIHSGGSTELPQA